jgi:sulfite exporter TauE/SafE
MGLIGSAFTLSQTATMTLSILIGLVMLILGINLLEVFPWAKRLQLHMPSFLSKRAYAAKNIEHAFAPFIIGAITFFLPCGFTQSMQLYSLGTGSVIKGALTMGAFALGTLPVLALISFTSVSFAKSPKAGVFFKIAGILVIAFALLNIVNGLAAGAIIRPLFNF